MEPLYGKKKFSIIIPSYNRATQLRACLEAIVRLDYPKEHFEVVVVDDGSHRPVNKLVDSFSPSLFTVVRQENGGPAKARNLGVDNAAGEILVFVDDDCCPDVNLLKNLARRFEKDTSHIVGGRLINTLDENPYSLTSQVILDAVYDYYNRDPDNSFFVATAIMAVNRSLFLEVGGFDEAFNTAEDREFCNRWRKRGFSITLASDVMVYHSHKLTFRGFCKQHFNYGRGAFNYHNICKSFDSGIPLNDLLFHLQLPRSLHEHISSMPVRKIGEVGLLLAIWEIVNAAGFLFEKSMDGITPKANNHISRIGH